MNASNCRDVTTTGCTGFNRTNISSKGTGSHLTLSGIRTVVLTLISMTVLSFVLHQAINEGSTNGNRTPAVADGSGSSPTRMKRQQLHEATTDQSISVVVSKPSVSATSAPGSAIDGSEFVVRDEGDPTSSSSSPAAVLPHNLTGIIWPGPRETSDRVNSQLDFARRYADQLRPTDGRNKVILMVGNWQWETWTEGQTTFKTDNCPVDNCLLTRDYARYRKTADAVMIGSGKGEQLRRYVWLPKPSNQIWIVKHKESPFRNHVEPHQLNNLVNWTYTYRRDSTIAFRRFTMRRKDSTGNSSQSPINYANGKTEKVAWVVSNCNPTSSRNKYVAELNRYIPVAMFGRCAKRPCSTTDCFSELGRQYKFYLSFENANCKDYITEKLYRNALANNMVPVVMGARREDYAAVAPPHSYILAEDFEGPQQLAAYLNKLSANDQLYNEYFRWKDDYEFEYNMKKNAFVWCRLCALLHLQAKTGYATWYTNYSHWWNGACRANKVPGRSWYRWS